MWKVAAAKLYVVINDMNAPFIATRFARPRFLPGDLALLQEASDVLTKVGVVAESKICDGEKGRGDLGRRFN